VFTHIFVKAQLIDWLEDRSIVLSKISYVEILTN